MKIITALFLLLALTPKSAVSKTVVEVTFNRIIALSDQIFIAKITSGKCLAKDCDQLPHSAPKEYSFNCIKPLLEKCPKINSFRSRHSLKIGSNYLLLRPIDADGKIFHPVELREDDTRVVFSGYFEGLYNTTLYKSEPDSESPSNYYYYLLKDVITVIHE